MQPLSPSKFRFSCNQTSTNAAPSLGSVLGGVLTQAIGWRWVFWLLAIVSGLSLLGFLMFFPETARTIVGNGGRSRDGILTIRFVGERANRTGEESKRRLRVPDPTACLRVLWNVNTAFVILTGSYFYSVFCCLGASLSSLCISLYGLSDLEAGLIYLPSGVGGIVAAYASGRLSSLLQPLQKCLALGQY